MQSYVMIFSSRGYYTSAMQLNTVERIRVMIKITKNDVKTHGAKNMKA